MNYTLIACRPTTQMQAPSQPTSANTRTCGPVDPPLLLAWDKRRSAKKGGNKKRSDVVEPARVSSTSRRPLSPTGALPREHEFGAWRGFWHMTCPPPIVSASASGLFPRGGRHRRRPRASRPVWTLRCGQSNPDVFCIDFNTPLATFALASRWCNDGTTRIERLV